MTTRKGEPGRDEVDVVLRISRQLEAQMRGYLTHTGTVTLCLDGQDPAILSIWFDPPPDDRKEGN